MNDEELRDIEQRIAPLFGFDVRFAPGRHFVNRTVIHDLAKFIKSRDQQIALEAQVFGLSLAHYCVEDGSKEQGRINQAIKALKAGNLPYGDKDSDKAISELRFRLDEQKMVTEWLMSGAEHVESIQDFNSLRRLKLETQLATLKAQEKSNV